MKLEQLAAKPKLIEITIDDEDIVKDLGEALTFWTWDRQPMTTFIKLASVDNNNSSSIMEAVRDLILNEQGKPILNDDVMLPPRILMRCMTRLVEGLGKF